MLRSIGEPVALIGYCLGGTMAIAAANLFAVERVVTLAAPWRFSHYPGRRKRRCKTCGSIRTGRGRPRRAADGGAAGRFWSLDPERTVRKFAEFGRLDPASAEARRFVELEEWANEGEPLPYPAANELVEDLFGDDLPGSGEMAVGGRAVRTSCTCPCFT